MYIICINDINKAREVSLHYLDS